MIRPVLSLTGADPDTYVPHPLHSAGRVYSETNCYSDLLIELLHSCGYEPLAAFGHVVRLDFEGDQWTFFKPPPADLEELYGVDIHEMQIYRPLTAHIAEQLSRDQTVIVEMDAFHLPDTAGTSYGAEHVKTSVAVEAIDPAQGRMLYYHGRGLHQISGSDYRGALGVDDPPLLPPYLEIVRLGPGALPASDLRQRALNVLRTHLRHVPAHNPFELFGEALELAMPELVGGEISHYHAYVFATLRMAGSAFEVLADHVIWLFGEPGTGVAGQIAEIVSGCRRMSLRLARRRVFDPAEGASAMAGAWHRAMAELAGIAEP